MCPYISISIISGGHSSVGMKGRLVISTRKMCTVEVDTTAMTVKIGGGCLAREVDAACAPHGIACVLGNAYTVGVAGLLMGGGYGHMARWQGLLVDTMLSATVVLASGEIVECSAESAEHAELFWALRGGGANFGVLVSVTVRAFKIGWDDPKGKGRLYGVGLSRTAHITHHCMRALDLTANACTPVCHRWHAGPAPWQGLPAGQPPRQCGRAQGLA